MGAGPFRMTAGPLVPTLPRQRIRDIARTLYSAGVPGNTLPLKGPEPYRSSEQTEAEPTWRGCVELNPEGCTATFGVAKKLRPTPWRSVPARHQRPPSRMPLAQRARLVLPRAECALGKSR